MFFFVLLDKFMLLFAFFLFCVTVFIYLLFPTGSGQGVLQNTYSKYKLKELLNPTHLIGVCIHVGFLLGEEKRKI